MLYQSPFTRRVILPKERPREARRLGLAISGLRRARKTAASNTQGKKRPMLYSYALSCTLLISSCCVMWCAQKLISSFNRPALIVRVVTLHANVLYHSCIDPSNVASVVLILLIVLWLCHVLMSSRYGSIKQNFDYCFQFNV